MSESEYDEEYMDSEERAERGQKYQKDYLDAMTAHAKSTPLDIQDEIFKEMQGIKYHASDNPQQDAELNFLRAEKIYRKKAKKKFGDSDSVIKSYSKFMGRADGLSDEDLRKKVKSWIGGVTDE